MATKRPRVSNRQWFDAAVDPGAFDNMESARAQVYNDLEDRMSQLPDEILTNMLSLLPIKEAGRSSVLSRRWRNLWKMTARLDLDAQEKLTTSLFNARHKRLWRSKRSKRYLALVNEVLKLHECPFIEEFRVKSDLDVTANNHISKWIEFLVPKRVKILEIDLSILGCSWTFDSCTLSQECYHNFRMFNFLRSVYLHSINMDGILLQYFLSGCSHLETLIIYFVKGLMNFNGEVTSPSLCHLEIFWCDLTTIELSAPKLVTFKYCGAENKFRISNNPCLTNLSLGGRYDEKVMDALVPFSEHLPQLETLHFNLWLDGFTEICMEIPQVPQLRNLKYLVLEVRVSGDTSIIDVATIIATAPVLDRLTLQIRCRDPIFRPSDYPSGLIHQSLRIVEFLQFIGFYSDLELASFLLCSAINLERIVIDPYSPRPGDDDDDSSGGGIEMETENISKRASEALKDRLPPKAKLVIL